MAKLHLVLNGIQSWILLLYGYSSTARKNNLKFLILHSKQNKYHHDTVPCFQIWLKFAAFIENKLFFKPNHKDICNRPWNGFSNRGSIKLCLNISAKCFNMRLYTNFQQFHDIFIEQFSTYTFQCLGNRYTWVWCNNVKGCLNVNRIYA